MTKQERRRLAEREARRNAKARGLDYRALRKRIEKARRQA